MAGERYSRLIFQFVFPGDGQQIQLTLAGQAHTFTARHGYTAVPGEYTVSTQAGTTNPLLTTADSLRYAIEQVLAGRGLGDKYQMVHELLPATTPEDADGDGYVDDPSVDSTGMYKGQITITARYYDAALDLGPLVDFGFGSPGNDYPRFREISRNPTLLPLTITPTVTVATCYGSSTAAVQLAVSGGQAPLSVKWDDNVTTLSRSNLPAGTYRVTLTDANQASFYRDVVVGQNARIDVVVQKTEAGVTLQASGGTPPLAFLWDDGSTDAFRDDLGEGTHACTITDAKGCTADVVVEYSKLNCYLVRNPIPLRLDAGALYRQDPTLKPNLTFVCQVLVEEQYLSNQFTAVGAELEQPADKDGRTAFQVQELLSPYLQYHVPAAVGPVAERAESLFKRFFLRYAQVYGTPPVRAAALSAEQHYVLLGGLSFTEARARTWHNSYQQQVRPFLTWEPREKEVFADQPEFLYYQALTATPSVRLVVELTFDDNSTQELNVGEVEGGVQRYEVFCFGCGFAQLRLERLPAEQRARIRSWRVWVADDDGFVVSEVRTYYLSQRQAPLRRYVLYANSLGGMNTFVAEGEAQLDAEVTGDQVELNLPLDYDPLAGDTAVLERELRPVLKLASGVHLGRVRQLGLQELLLTRRALLWNAGRWLAGYVKTKTVNVLDDGRPVPTLEIDFVLPAERQFTPYLPPLLAGQSAVAVGPDSGAL
ncbi:SprB repeat-containing protein [Hymenobacter pini]|uniref:SprB repeat-containing protein n=1 Tax=Hymenobacter pini TaxID=2880879 RepID=UPI001CF3AEFF|nr:SprB repeat-containing protein [Hymenobacter pini]MCA8830520.1 SprB repeat-containing protein [Hymenobacter pini]